MINENAFVVLKTKLIGPPAVDNSLKRMRLINKLEAATRLKASFIISEAGSGKTTLISDFLEYTQLPAVWYHIDTNDSDPVTFFTYLVNSLRQLYPKFGMATMKQLADKDRVRSGSSDAVVDTFINDIYHQVKKKTVLVLDNFHCLDDSAVILAIVERLLCYLPESLHLIISSRTQPEIKLARLSSIRAISLIGYTDLLFNESEIKQLFESVYKEKLSAEWAHEYYCLTDGWITGLQYINESAPRDVIAHGSSKNLIRYKRALSEIFQYFKEEVLSSNYDNILPTLASISEPEVIDPQVCTQVLNIENAQEWLQRLVTRNLFLTQQDLEQSTYRFNPLFRAYLQELPATTEAAQPEPAQPQPAPAQPAPVAAVEDKKAADKGGEAGEAAKVVTYQEKALRDLQVVNTAAVDEHKAAAGEDVLNINIDQNDSCYREAAELTEKMLAKRQTELSKLMAFTNCELPSHVIKLQRSQLLLAAWEAKSFILSDPDYNQSHCELIRRSIVLQAEIQELGASFRELLNSSSADEIREVLSRAKYCLDQAEIVSSALDIQSHSERSASRFGNAQNLLATRQKLTSTINCLLTLIKWLNNNSKLEESRKMASNQ